MKETRNDLNISEYYKIYLALEKQMSAEQREVIEAWERRHCVQGDLLFRPTFQSFCTVVEEHADEMRALSFVAKTNRACRGVCRAFVNRHPYEQYEMSKRKPSGRMCT